MKTFNAYFITIISGIVLINLVGCKLQGVKPDAEFAGITPGAQLQGATVTIDGNNFYNLPGANNVTFEKGGIKYRAEVIEATSKKLKVIVPSIPTGEYSVFVDGFHGMYFEGYGYYFFDNNFWVIPQWPYIGSVSIDTTYSDGSKSITIKGGVSNTEINPSEAIIVEFINPMGVSYATNDNTNNCLLSYYYQNNSLGCFVSIPSGTYTVKLTVNGVGSNTYSNFVIP